MHQIDRDRLDSITQFHGDCYDNHMGVGTYEYFLLRRRLREFERFRIVLAIVGDL